MEQLIRGETARMPLESFGSKLYLLLQILAVAVRRLQAAVYVGDTPPDMAAAVQGGARAVGVATGSFTGHDLYGAGAEIVLDSLTAFPDWYRSVFSPAVLPTGS